MPFLIVSRRKSQGLFPMAPVNVEVLKICANKMISGDVKPNKNIKK